MEINKFNARNRCDRCNAQALVRVKINENYLDFCGHHYNKYSDALEEQGGEVIHSEMENLITKDQMLVDA